MRQFYISKNNQNVGPMPPEQLVQQGLTPNSMVWAEGMPTWVPASQVPELAPYLAAATRPQYQQPYQQPSYQKPAQPAMNISTTNIFKFVLGAVLLFTAIVSLIMFINSFTFIHGFFKAEVIIFGVLALICSLFALIISIVLATRLAQKKSFGFLSFIFFVLTFLFSLLDMIIVGSWTMFILLMVAGILGIVCTIFAFIPIEKIGDSKHFNALMNDKSSGDLGLAITYGIFMLGLLILGAIIENFSEFLENFSLYKERIKALSKARSMRGF